MRSSIGRGPIRKKNKRQNLIGRVTFIVLLIGWRIKNAPNWAGKWRKYIPSRYSDKKKFLKRKGGRKERRN